MGETIAITGAAGGIGQAVLPLLRRPERRFVLIDRAEVPGAEPGDTVHALEVTDEPGMTAALRGVDAVIHLAGIPHETDWDSLRQTNIHGTKVVLEAARAGGARRVMLASSIHAAGMWTFADAVATETLLPRPEGFYGVTKAAMEALGSMYADRYDMAVVSARICAFGENWQAVRSGTLWFAAEDAARLIEAVVALRSSGHHIVWGVSAVGARAMRLNAGQGIGFLPEAEASADAPVSAPDDLLAAEAAADRNPPGQQWR